MGGGGGPEAVQGRAIQALGGHGLADQVTVTRHHLHRTADPYSHRHTKHTHAQRHVGTGLDKEAQSGKGGAWDQGRTECDDCGTDS